MGFLGALYGRWGPLRLPPSIIPGKMIIFA